MIARTPISVIASAVGVLATCLVLTPLNGHLASAQTSDGSNVKAWFNRNGSAGGGQTVAANANQPTAGPLHKFSARVSSMGQSVKKAFTGSTQKSAGNQPKAEDDAITLSKPAQPRADFYLSLGRIQERAGNSTGAVEQYKRALELEPGNLAALMALARFYDRQGQLPDALKYYKQATVAHPQEAAAYNDQGLCYARQQQYPEAAACLRKAVELRADRVLYRNNLATVQVEMGQIDQAFHTLAPAHGAAIAHYNLGFLLNKRGETAQALQQFKLAAASDASFEAAQQWVETLTTKLAGDPTGAGPVASRQPSAPVASPDLKRNMAPALGLAGGKPNIPSIRAAETPTTASPAEPPAAASNAIASAEIPKQRTAPPLTMPAPMPAPTPAVALAPSPDTLAMNNPVRNPSSQPANNAPVAPPVASPASPPVSSLTLKEAPAESVAPPPARFVKPSPTVPPPGPVLQLAPQRGPGIVRPRTDQNDGGGQLGNRETRRSQTTELVSQRLTRLPPTPDEIQVYSQGVPAVDPANAIVPLPPVDAGHYPASRY